MPGSRRSSVTIADGTLASAGFIYYCRGKIQVLDRARLQEASWDCYGVFQRDYELLIGKDAGSVSLRTTYERGGVLPTRRVYLK